MSATATIVDAVRTPFGRRGGALAGTHPAELLGGTIAELLARTGVDPAAVDQVIGGCAEKTGDQGFNITRTAWLTAGLPAATPAITVDAQCGSSHQAVTSAHGLIAAGHADVVIACGVESMSRVPIGTTFFQGPGTPVSAGYRRRYGMPDQFASAEAMAECFGISREDCDALAARSNTLAEQAWTAGAFDTQLVRPARIERDETIRPADLAALAALEPLGDGARHTRASASKLADGASAVLLMAEDKAAALGVPVAARLLDSVLVGVEPELMLSGPLAVTPRLLARNGMTLDDVDLVEINEAFASVVLAWAADTGADMTRVNVQGGALAMGHPIGATGAALVARAVHALQLRDAEIALVTMCCGGGLGTGTLIARA